MCHDVLQDPTFFRYLTQIDREFAALTRAGRCVECAGPLHVADYPRKPRGCPASVCEEYSRRFSFTCGRCDARATAQSVRFAGRRMYVAVMLMLASPPSSMSGQRLSELLGVPGSTVQRWRTWWRRELPTTTFWKSACTRFMPPLVNDDLPLSMVERFDGSAPIDRLVQALRFVAPLSTRPRSGNPTLAA